MDISDGLASDLHRICEASKVGVEIWENQIPVSRDTRNIQDALTEGEDFELLFTLSGKESGDSPRVPSEVRPKPQGLQPITAIGRVVDRKNGVKIIRRGGRVETLKESGFDHFK